MSSSTPQDPRLAALSRWTRDQLNGTAFPLEPVPGDAGERRYFRLPPIAGHPPLLAVDAPPDTQKNAAFIDIAQVLKAHALNVPDIIAADLTQGFLLINNLGSERYLSALNLQTADQLHSDAITALLSIQSCSREHFSELPAYDEDLLLKEMQLFPELLLKKYLQLDLSTETTQPLNNLFSLLMDEALAQPQVCVHFDYHPRNLLVCEKNNPGIIDFQDACWGPITYDLASLFRDNFVWPRENIAQWVWQYQQHAQAKGLLPDDLDRAEFLRWFDWMSLQRLLKLLGLFVELGVTKNAPHYFDYFKVTFQNAVDVTSRYDAFSFLNTLLIEKVAPALKTQPWDLAP